MTDYDIIIAFLDAFKDMYLELFNRGPEFKL